MATKNVALPIVLSSIDSATFSGAYQLLSAAAGLPYACIILRFTNVSNRDVTISYDGIYDHDFLPIDDQLTLNFQTNNQPSAHVSCIPVGTKIYIKGGELGTGSVYLTGYYNPQGV